MSQFAEPLEALRLWDGSEMPSGLRRRGLRVYAHHECLRQQISAVEAARRAMRQSATEAAIEQVRQLMHLRGIGSKGAWGLVRACFAWRELKHRREVGG